MYFSTCSQTISDTKTMKNLSKTYNFYDLIRTPKIRRLTVIAGIMWCVALLFILTDLVIWWKDHSWHVFWSLTLLICAGTEWPRHITASAWTSVDLVWTFISHTLSTLPLKSLPKCPCISSSTLLGGGNARRVRSYWQEHASSSTSLSLTVGHMIVLILYSPSPFCLKESFTLYLMLLMMLYQSSKFLTKHSFRAIYQV